MIRIVSEEVNDETESERSKYLKYLDDHISSVKRSWYEILYPTLVTESDLTVEDFTKIQNVIDTHDQSKYSTEEFLPYLHHFYPTEENPDNEEEFDMAWLHHQKVNPHHWQYWVLIRDKGSAIVPMDMPLEYVIEMLCDWHSFSYKNPESTAYKWYQDNKNQMILSKNTKDLIDKYIAYLKDPLSLSI